MDLHITTQSVDGGMRIHSLPHQLWIHRSPLQVWICLDHPADPHLALRSVLWLHRLPSPAGGEAMGSTLDKANCVRAGRPTTLPDP